MQWANYYFFFFFSNWIVQKGKFNVPTVNLSVNWIFLLLRWIFKNFETSLAKWETNRTKKRASFFKASSSCLLVVCYSFHFIRSKNHIAKLSRNELLKLRKPQKRWLPKNYWRSMEKNFLWTFYLNILWKKSWCSMEKIVIWTNMTLRSYPCPLHRNYLTPWKIPPKKDPPK